MKRINTILKSILLPSSWEGLGVGFLLLLASCTGKPVPGLVAEEDSLFIDTVASLDDELAPDTIAVPDSLILDSL